MVRSFEQGLVSVLIGQSFVQYGWERLRRMCIFGMCVFLSVGGLGGLGSLEPLARNFQTSQS